MRAIHTIHTRETARACRATTSTRIPWALAALLVAACSGGSDDNANPADAAVAADAPPNTLTEAEQAAGWQLLFDGETTTARGAATTRRRSRTPAGRWSTEPEGSDSNRSGRRFKRRRHRHHRVLHRLRPEVRVHALRGGEQRGALQGDRRRSTGGRRRWRRRSCSRAGSTSRTGGAGLCSPILHLTLRFAWATGTPCACVPWATGSRHG